MLFRLAVPIDFYAWLFQVLAKILAEVIISFNCAYIET